MGQHLVFRGQGGGRVLDHHQTAFQAAVLRQKHGQNAAIAVGIDQSRRAPLAHIAQFGQRQRRIIHRNGNRFAMKIAGRDDIDFARFLIHKNERVVVDRVEFDVDNPLAVGDGIAHRAMNLGHTAQRVRVLHVERIAAAQQLAAGNKLAQKSGIVNLARMGADGMDAGIEGAVGAVEGFQTQAGGGIGR